MKGLKQMREERKLTQVAVARAVGVAVSSVSMWECGESFPRRLVLNKLCEFFNCKVDDLL